MIKNKVKSLFAEGRPAIGAGAYLARTVQIAPILARAGFDWVFIDLEHSAMDLDDAAQIAVTSLAYGITPIARVPGGDHGLAARLLDAGALGIVMPHVDDAEQAREMVRLLRYPPVGGRSCGYGMASDGFHAKPPAESMKEQDSEVLLIAMLETRKAISNAASIAAVPGIDVLMLGTLDLSIDMGVPGEFESSDIREAYEHVTSVCITHQKIAGMAGISAAAQVRDYMERGALFILAGSDVSMLVLGAAEKIGVIRDALTSERPWSGDAQP